MKEIEKKNDFLAFLDAIGYEEEIEISDIHHLYLNALYNQLNGNSEPMNRFKLLHPDFYKLANENYHKRKIIKENILAMKMVSKNLVWGALTFDEEHDKQSIETKRKQALRHLNKYLCAFLFVEELGSMNERYHIHYIGILRNSVLYLDFINGWHSRCDIEKLYSMKQATNYLTDYMTKQAPRIRRSKDLIELHKRYKKSIMWKNYGFSSLSIDEKNNAVINLVFDL